MKRNFFKFLLTLVIIGWSVSSWANDFEIDGINYDVISFTELTVTASSLSESKSGEINIPATVTYNGKVLSVIRIGPNFASNNPNITVLSLGDNIEEIEANAFYRCEQLAEISFGKKVRIIGNNSFQGCVNLIEIANESIKEVGKNAFEGCKKLETVELINLTSIPEGMFENCISLTNCTTPSLSKIERRAFANCASLVNINLPESLVSIEEQAFEECTILSEFIIPNSVQSIGSNVLKNNISLSRLVIGNGIKKLPYIISGCNKLREVIIVDSKNILEFGVSQRPSGWGSSNYIGATGPSSHGTRYYYYQSPSYFADHPIENVYIGRNLTTYPEEFDSNYQSGAYLTEKRCYLPTPPFSGTTVKNVCFGDLVTEMPYMTFREVGAFENCSTLVSCELGSSIHSIGSRAFSGCESLPSQILPNTVKKIGNSAFKGCSSLKSVSLGCYLTSIEYDCFDGCYSLSSIDIYAIIPPTYPTGFSSQDYLNTCVSIPPGTLSTYQESEPWKNFWNLVESKKQISLFEVDGIKYLVSKDGNVQIIGENFSSSQNLVINPKVTYEGVEFNVTSISDKAFINCSFIESLDIKEGLLYIGQNAFEGCNNLKEASLPLSLNVIGNGAFKNCYKLETLNLSKPIQNIPEECFYGCSFSDFSFEDVKSIGNSSFYNCYNLSKVVIPPSVETFGSNSFGDCRNLREFIIEDSDSSVEFPSGSYYGITNLQKKEVNGEIVQFKISYYNSYFNGLPIEKLYIGRNLSEKSRYTISGDGGVNYYLITSYDAPFSSLTQLKELEISENVSVIGPQNEYIREVDMYSTSGSFKKCSNLELITVKSSLPPVGAEFSSTTYCNAKLIVPDNTISFYQDAEGWKEFANIINESSSGIENTSARIIQPPFHIGECSFTWNGAESELSIYTLDGSLLKRKCIKKGESLILASGLYIVNTPIGSFKVKL